MSPNRRQFVTLAATSLAATALLAGCSTSSKPAAAGSPSAKATTSPATKTTTPKPSASAPASPSAAPAVELSAGVQRQLAYAAKYWKTYNTAQYGNLNSVGGDCANFVSQSLQARGWTQNSTWYNRTATGGSWGAAWGYVPAMENYFAANASRLGLVRLTSSERAKFAVGDVVAFSWSGSDDVAMNLDHVQFITKIVEQGGKTKVLMASHNDDYLYRDLDHEITVEHPGAQFHVWHLTRDTNA